MKNALRVSLAVLLVSALVAPGMAAGALGGYSPWTTDRFVVHSLAADGTARSYYEGSISDYRVAYEMSTDTTSQVLVCDLRSETTSTIDDGLQTQMYPSIGGSQVLYAGYDGEDWGLYEHLIGEDESTLITKTADAVQPDVDGETGFFCFDQGNRRIVSKDSTVKPTTFKDLALNSRVYVGYLEAPTGIDPLNDSDAAQFGSKISGDYVAYFEASETPDLFNVKLQNLKDPDDVITVATGIEPGELAFSGDIVTWQEWKVADDGYILKGFDLSEDRPFTVYSNLSYSAEDPVVAGTKIYFVADSPGSEYSQLIAYDVTGDMYALLPGVPDQYALDAQGDKIVWSGAQGTADSYIAVSTLGQPNVYIDTDSFVDYDTMPFVSGFVVDDGIGIGGAEVALQISADGQIWETVNTATADGDGDFFLNAPKLKTYANYRVVYAGKPYDFLGDAAAFADDVQEPEHFSARSQTEVVVARAKVGIPSALPVLKKDQNYTAKGLISPRQDGNIQASGRIECYQKVRGNWVYKKSYSVKFNSSGYWAQTKFTSRGDWKYRMHFLGSNNNAPDYGPWRGFTVK